ncbi:MAG: patatin-like phospholipase family protein [Hyphococcus sp.]
MADSADNHPDDRAARPLPLERPSIGVALGGGVARGWAHIGALSRLEELGVKPEIVAGTSVGALVGGFWLAGHLDALEGWARSLTKRRMLTYVDFMLTGSGLMGGKRLQKTMSQYLGDMRIEDLPSRFVAVTAELATGHETWLRSGRLADALEAAYALPGVFPPRVMDGRWVIDGALINPLPVSVCRAFDARLVIAIGLHADAFGRASAQRKEKYENPEFHDGEELAKSVRVNIAEKAMLRRLFKATGPAPGLGSVMLASFNIIMDRTTRSRLAGDPPDVLIMPQVGHIALLDFDRADELITLGREAIDRQWPQIEKALEFLA